MNNPLINTKSLSRRRCITCERQMNKHQIRRIDSYVQLSWKTQEDCWRARQECGCAESIQGQSGRINYLPSDIKQGKESYASSVACVAGSPVTACVGNSLVEYVTTSLQSLKNRLLKHYKQLVVVEEQNLRTQLVTKAYT